jgi:hypothetical protein
LWNFCMHTSLPNDHQGRHRHAVMKAAGDG